MLLKKRKTEEFHFTPEQEACLAKCREFTNDELRILNGGSYKGMPSSVQMQQGLSGGSSNNDSSSSSGTSKGHNGMPSDVEAMLEHSGSSSATETSSSAGQTTVTTVFRSIDDMVGPYVSVGASFSVDRFSAGGDVILNFAGEPVGVTSSAGMNLCSIDKSVLVGLEAHARFGTTVVYPLIKNR